MHRNKLAGSTHPRATKTAESKEAPGRRHRRRLAELDPKPQRLSMQEERAALREELGLPPHMGY